jgi:hypothetical protein
MRLQPVAALPLTRVAVRDLQLSNGMVIPAGMMIETAQYTPMRDARWGWQHGDKFIPVRDKEPASLCPLRAAAVLRAGVCKLPRRADAMCSGWHLDGHAVIFTHSASSKLSTFHCCNQQCGQSDWSLLLDVSDATNCLS